MNKDEQPKPKHHQAHKAQKKVFDVTRPGHAPASPNSRSVVVTGTPVADDQFVPTAPTLRAADPNAKHELLNAKNRKELQPLSAPTVTDSTAAEAAVRPAEATPELTAPDAATSAVPAAPAVASAPVLTPANPTPSNTPKAQLAAEPELPKPEETPSSAPAVPLDETEAAEDTPAHFAMEQTVQTNAAGSQKAQEVPGAPKSTMPIWEHPDTSEQVQGSAPAAGPSRSGKTIEDLLAETGAPTLEPEKTPLLIVSHHKTRHVPWWEPLLIFLLIVVIAAVALNFLLDADIIKTSLSIPHTDLLQ